MGVTLYFLRIGTEPSADFDQRINIEEAERQLEVCIEFGLAQDSIYMAQGELAHVKGQYESVVEYLEQTISITDDMQKKERFFSVQMSIRRWVAMLLTGK